MKRYDSVDISVWSVVALIFGVGFGMCAGYTPPADVIEPDRVPLEAARILSARAPGNASDWGYQLIEAARSNGIEDTTALYLARMLVVESWGTPTAVSVAGALGLMQVMPFWQESEPEFCAGDLFDPVVGIVCGTRIFAIYLAECDGLVVCAMNRYSGYAMCEAGDVVCRGDHRRSPYVRLVEGVG